MSMNGVKFDDIHSYYDLNLILSQCSISPAKPKTNYVEIPGGDGSIDLTEALGDIRYNDRTGQLVFTMLPDAGDFEEKKSEISNLLNGKKFKITLDKDPDWYYIGRCTINDWKCNKLIGQITVDLKLQPFKYAPETVLNYRMVNDVVLFIKGLPIVPAFEFGTMASIDFGDKNYPFSAGKHKNPDIVFVNGENHFTINTAQTTTISYQERSL